LAFKAFVVLAREVTGARNDVISFTIFSNMQYTGMCSYCTKFPLFRPECDCIQDARLIGVHDTVVSIIYIINSLL